MGASARAAAWSARRAGLTPAAADLFADRDLCGVADCVRVEPGGYPDGLESAAGELPPGAWMYTGAIENNPDLVDRISARRTLLGNGSAILRGVRDPVGLVETLRCGGYAAPEVREEFPGGDVGGCWLRKPRASGGGVGIEVASRGENTLGRSFYYQEQIDGTSHSAVFIGTKAGAILAGITRQLTGVGERAFVYRGSIAPWEVTDAVSREVASIGNHLAGRFGLVGLFGIDFILSERRAWTVEVNPRYTGAVEVVELAFQRSLIQEHVRACHNLKVSWGDEPKRVVGKEIIYANAEFRLGEELEVPSFSTDEPFHVPGCADIPGLGSVFGAGEPVLTVFAEGTTIRSVVHEMNAERKRWEERLGICWG